MSNSLRKLIFNSKVKQAMLFTFFVVVFFVGFSQKADAYEWGVLADKWYYLGTDYRSEEWENEQQINEAIRSINELRIQYGKKPLEKDPILMDAAEVRAREIVGKFDHFRPDGTRPYTATGGVYQNVGENLGKGQVNTEQVMEEWLNSPEHKKNIFIDEYVKIGVATYKKDGITYWVHLFLAE